MYLSVTVCSVASVVSHSLQHYGPQSTRLFCPWDSPCKNGGVGCSQASTPQIRIYLLYCFMISPTPLTLWGVVPHRFSRRRSKHAAPSQQKFLGMTRVFQLTDSSEGYLAHLYRFVWPHVIVYSLPIWEAGDVLDLLKANSFGELEIISIVGWLGIILVKGFSFVVSIIAANSLLWVGQGCLRANLSADRLACVTGLSILLPHDCLLSLNHKQHREFWRKS